MHQRPPAVVHVAQEHLPWATLISDKTPAHSGRSRAVVSSSALSCRRRMNCKSPAHGSFNTFGASQLPKSTIMIF